MTTELGDVNDLTQWQLYWVNCAYKLLVWVNFEVKMCVERKIFMPVPTTMFVTDTLKLCYNND